MNHSEAYKWTKQSERRQRILVRLTQPMAAKQLAKNTGLTRDECSHALATLATRALVVCLNADARRNRLYWLTGLGAACQRRLHTESGCPTERSDLPRVDWHLYGSVCHSHRGAVIRALTEPLPPATIKRRARSHNPAIRMSANNVRDVIRVFLKRGIVRPLREMGKAHPRYELTELGSQFRRLLVDAESVG